MGVLQGLDADVWVTGTPSVSIGGAPETCANSDSGVYKRYRASTHYYWDKQQTLTVQTTGNDRQVLVVTGSPTGGTVKLAFSGQTMAGTIASTCTSAQMKTALELLSSIGSNNTTCTGGPWPDNPIYVDFVGTMANTNEPLITVNTNSLTGGTNPAVTITSVNDGGTNVAAVNYSFEYPGGYVVFPYPLAAATTVRIFAGYYFPVAQLALCHNWELDLKANVIDVSIFQQSSWGASQAAMLKASGKIDSFLSDGTLDASLAQLMVFVLYLDKSANIRMECYGWLTGLAIKDAMAGVVEKGITFDTDGQVFYRTVA
jgi:hypothetical protein